MPLSRAFAFGSFQSSRAPAPRSGGYSTVRDSGESIHPQMTPACSILLHDRADGDRGPTILRSIIEDHGGPDFEATQNPDQGATFEFALPVVSNWTDSSTASRAPWERSRRESPILFEASGNDPRHQPSDGSRNYPPSKGRRTLSRLCLSIN